jgi:hypothetical protein
VSTATARIKPAAYLTAKDLADKLNMHPETIRRLARAGLIRGAVRIRRDWRFAPDWAILLRNSMQP